MDAQCNALKWWETWEALGRRAECSRLNGYTGGASLQTEQPGFSRH